MRTLDKVIVIDQSPIGRTPRSNPATYTGMFNHIRDLFARLPAAHVRGYAPGRFSFNVKGGRCEKCEGDGVIKIEMHFLPPVYVTCEACGGRRYNRETLEITYKGKNIADVLDLTVDEAVHFFRAVPQIYDPLLTLAEVGLGYIRLGQAGTTLSGGEAQRVKLAAELSRKATGQTLYILDEPTTGLHFHDVDKLLEVLFKLRGAGNTLVGHRAQSRCDQIGRLGDRPRPGRRRRRRPHCGRRHARASRALPRQLHRSVLTAGFGARRWGAFDGGIENSGFGKPLSRPPNSLCWPGIRQSNAGHL